MRSFWILMLCLVSMSAFAADDLPVTVKVGGTVFSDFTHTADDVRPSAFQLTRAYVNVTATVTPYLSLRVTPDFAKDNGRLKYAYGQLNLDTWVAKGSWLRVGTQPTPYLEYVDSVYRYRFQGTSFVEREGFLSSADNGVSVRYAFANDRGDVHAGYYNGEGYTKAESNDAKAFQVRATARPLKGVRLTGFASLDHANGDVARDRFVATASYEHARFNGGVDLLAARDAVDSRGWSAWVTPKLGKGFEALLRHDAMTEPKERTRDIVGLAYWMALPKGTTAGVLVDRDETSGAGQPDDTRYGVHVVLTF